MLSAAPLLAGLAGAAGAAMHHAGALKSVPLLAASPLDLTALALGAVLLLLPPALAGRGGAVLHRPLALPLLAAAALPVWWVVAAAWSASAPGAADRLPEIALLGPLMLLLGLGLGAEPAARRALAGASLLIGAAVAAAVLLGLLTDTVVLGGRVGADPARTRVQYQVAGLSIATAAALAGLRAAAAAGAGRRLLWAAAAAALLGAALLPGGRAGLLAAALGATLAPAAFLWLSGRARLALLWPLLWGGGAMLVLGAALADPEWAPRLFTVERLLRDGGGVDGARALLWGVAWRGADGGGLGPGGFPVLAGMGEARGFHPHNHAIEALLEGGLVGLLLWLSAFGGGALALLARMGRVEPRRAAEVLALCLPVSVAVMVSTDLGNRMAWFALGLALSLSVSVRRDV